MKKALLLSISVLAMVSMVFAQNGNIVIFSEGGERFTAILNGERVNPNPGTNVKVTDLNQPGYKLKVIFEDARFGEVSKDIMVAAGEETVYMVKLDKKGAYKVAWRSSTPIAQAPSPAPSQQIYSWAVPVATVTSAPAPAPAPTTTVVVQETITTAPQPAPTGENVSMNVSAPGFNMNVNMSGSGTQAPPPASTTVITTTTTTSQPQNQTLAQPAVVEQQPACMGMEKTAFDGACNSIKAKSFEDSKLTLAKQVASSNCLLASQVKSVMDLLTFEESKLEFAKYAWANCPDRQNYYQVNDGFGFESTIEELDAFIQSQR